MKKSILVQWEAALRDPKYAGKEGLFHLFQRSLFGTQRWNPEGILYEVLKAQQDYETFFGLRVMESNVFAQVTGALITRPSVRVLALVLSVDGEQSKSPTYVLPQLLCQYAGLDQVPEIHRAKLAQMTSENVSFTELANYIHDNF